MLPLLQGHQGQVNQLTRPAESGSVTPKDLMTVPPGGITLEGVRFNVSIGVRFIESWLRGVSQSRGLRVKANAILSSGNVFSAEIGC